MARHCAFHISTHLQKLHLHINVWQLLHTLLSHVQQHHQVDFLILFPIRYPFVVCWYVKFPFHIFQAVRVIAAFHQPLLYCLWQSADCITVDTGTNIALVSETGMEFAMPNGFTLYPSMITVSSEKQLRALYHWALCAHVLHLGSVVAYIIQHWILG